MPYICLGYLDETQWEAMSESERNALMDSCFAYNDVLRKHGYFVGGVALQSAQNATTLRYQNGKVSLTDGPYAETKEQLGGILILEATDLNHAIQLMAKHPGVQAGPARFARLRTCQPWWQQASSVSVHAQHFTSLITWPSLPYWFGAWSWPSVRHAVRAVW